MFSFAGICSNNLLQYLMSLHSQIKAKSATVKVKSAFVKALFFICKDFNDESEQKKETVQRYTSLSSIFCFFFFFYLLKDYDIFRLLVEATLNDIYFAPFLINFMQHSVDTQIKIGILRILMPELLKPSKNTQVSHTAFECALEIMKQAVATRDSNISRPKVCYQLLFCILNSN
jgi:hypothetical protein